LARLGSSKPVELAGSREDLIAGFDVGSFGAAPTKFDAEDLFPLTRHHVQGLPFASVQGRIATLGVPDDMAEAFWAVAKGNITVLDDLAEWSTLFRDGAEPMVEPEDAAFVTEAVAMLPPRPWTQATWGEWTEAVKAATGRKGKGLYMPLRKALTGRANGPEMADVMPLLKVVKAV
jgi:glutamyl-tRNA synthetase